MTSRSQHDPVTRPLQPARHWGICTALVVAAVLFCAIPAARGQAPGASPAGGPEYAGADACSACHEDQARQFNATVMGKAFAHPRTEEQKLGCEACHGPGKKHVEAGGSEAMPVTFTKNSKNSADEKNNACLTCHSGGNRLFWKGGPHQSRSMTCVQCHTGHGADKEVPTSSEVRYNSPLSENHTLKKQQPELCVDCHQMRRAQLQRSSHMPYREGKVTCTSCHNPHGSANPKQLIQATVNENCLTCHTERRGPFLYEHPPVMENCANCHEPHGTNNPQLLKVRAPRVCDTCHVATRHPVTPTVTNSVRDFNRGCTNCHAKIHGSNHPSGNFFLR